MSPFGRFLPAKRVLNRIFRILNDAAAVKRQCCCAHAHHLFEETSQRDLYSLNSRLASYFRNDDALAAWDLFVDIHRTRSDLTAYTFTPVLGACSALPDSNRGQQVHALMIKLGLDSGIITKTALVDMYSKYGQLGASVRLFDEIGFKDVVAWNAMLSAYLLHGFPVKALGVFEAMRNERVEFSEFTLCSMLKACTSLNAFQQGKQVHALVIVIGRDLVVLSTALIDFYSTVGYAEEAIKVYRNLNCQGDDVIRNSLISGCVQNHKYDAAMSIMSTMKPNIIALTTVLAACSENSDLWIGRQIHGVAIRWGLVSDTQLCNVLLDMYAKCGKISNARLLFDQIPCKDVISWTSMIDAYGSHGDGNEALELFNKMGKGGNNVLPNSLTLLAVLSACGHSGFVEEARDCFAVSQDKYGVTPGPEHYACFIDIIGRSGEIEEAWHLFHNMVKNGDKPTSAVWAALLNACRLSRDVARGELAAKQLFELEPNNPSHYVALSNLYAAIGRWDSVDMLRTIMKDGGIAKEAGNSWVTLSSPNKNRNGLLG